MTGRSALVDWANGKPSLIDTAKFKRAIIAAIDNADGQDELTMFVSALTCGLGLKRARNRPRNSQYDRAILRFRASFGSGLSHGQIAAALKGLIPPSTVRNRLREADRGLIEAREQLARIMAANEITSLVCTRVL